MDDSKWERWASWGGILFVVLSAITFALPGSPPKTSDTATKIGHFVNDKRAELRWSGYLGALAVVALLWWLGSVWRLIRRAEGGTPRLAVVATAGAVFGAVMLTISGIILGAIPIVGLATLSSNGARIFYIIATNLGIATIFGMAVFIAAFSVVILRSKVMPTWLGWVGLLIAVVGVLGGGGVGSTRDVFFFGSFAAVLGFLIWTLIVSILMLMGRVHEPGGARTATAAPSPSPAS